MGSAALRQRGENPAMSREIDKEVFIGGIFAGTALKGLNS
jgi:hypothetical protein